MIMTILEQETMNAVKNYCNSKANIDWEQRRYEIAKSVLQGLFASDNQSSYEELASYAVAQADALIIELKKQKQ